MSNIKALVQKLRNKYPGISMNLCLKAAKSVENPDHPDQMMEIESKLKGLVIEYGQKILNTKPFYEKESGVFAMEINNSYIMINIRCASDFLIRSKDLSIFAKELSILMDASAVNKLDKHHKEEFIYDAREVDQTNMEQIKSFTADKMIFYYMGLFQERLGVSAMRVCSKEFSIYKGSKIGEEGALQYGLLGHNINNNSDDKSVEINHLRTIGTNLYNDAKKSEKPIFTPESIKYPQFDQSFCHFKACYIFC